MQYTPYAPYNSGAIDRYVTSDGGNYVLGTFDSEGNPVVQYVGKADDLNRRLKEHLEEFSYCKWFGIIYESDEMRRYYNECYDYHSFGGSAKLKNKIHPAKPGGLSWWSECPVCGR